MSTGNMGLWSGPAVLLLIAMPTIVAWASEAVPESGDQGAGHPLVCRGVEEVGRMLIGQPGFGAHVVSLFATGPNPRANSQSREEHVAWATDPLHSYIADGTGALCVWAHPDGEAGPAILALPGLTGMELLNGDTGSPTKRDRMWDQVLTQCYEAGRVFLWGFVGDDTHALDSIDHGWYSALLPHVDEFALKHALRTGAFYVSTGPRVTSVRVTGMRISLGLAQTADVFWLRSGQYLDGAMPGPMAVSSEPGANRCVQADRGVRTATLDAAVLGLTARERFVRAVICSDGAGIAFTQPWRLSPKGVGNPYPPSGTWVKGQTHNHTDSPPRASNLRTYRDAYRQKGQLGSFSVDYSYWDTPYQWLPEDGTPQIAAVVPDRLPVGEQAEILVTGVNFARGSQLQLGAHPLTVLEARGETELRAAVPGDLPVGVFDVVVTTPHRLRDTLASAFTVQERTTSPGWHSYTVADGLPYPRCTAVARVGDEIWVTSVSGLARHTQGHWSTWGSDDPLRGEPGYALLADPAGGAWATGDLALVRCYADGRSEQIKIDDQGHFSQRWGRMALDKRGDLWLANRWWSGLGTRQGGEWRRLRTADGLPADSPTAITCDTNHDLWVGFETEGLGLRTLLYRLVGSEWQPVSLPDAVQECDFVSVLDSSPDGSVWAALTMTRSPNPGAVVHFSPDAQAIVYEPGSGLPTARIRDILVASDRSTWFASDYGVSVLAKDGAIWCATANGVSCYSRPSGR